MFPSVAVVVPVHNFELGLYEKIGLEQIKKNLNHFPLYLIFPRKGKPPKKVWSNFHHIEIKKVWGTYGKTTIQSYASMLRSAFFYELFEKFDFLLIAQLDTYIFSSELQRFTLEPYDYWGAPWLIDLYSQYPYLRDLVRAPIRPYILHKILQKYLPRKMYYYVGNGGLSLRRVSKFIRACNEHTEINSKFDERIVYWKKLGYDVSFEDNFWCLFFPKFAPGFLRFPPWHKALQFAFELAPSLAYKLNQNKLPFGVHSWFKHDKDFWKRFIFESTEGTY